jgi:hypothetical protein
MKLLASVTERSPAMTARIKRNTDFLLGELALSARRAAYSFVLGAIRVRLRISNVCLMAQPADRHSKCHQSPKGTDLPVATEI